MALGGLPIGRQKASPAGSATANTVSFPLAIPSYWARLRAMGRITATAAEFEMPSVSSSVPAPRMSRTTSGGKSAWETICTASQCAAPDSTRADPSATAPPYMMMMPQFTFSSTAAQSVTRNTKRITAERTEIWASPRLWPRIAHAATVPSPIHVSRRSACDSGPLASSFLRRTSRHGAMSTGSGLAMRSSANAVTPSSARQSGTAARIHSRKPMVSPVVWYRMAIASGLRAPPSSVAMPPMTAPHPSARNSARP